MELLLGLISGLLFPIAIILIIVWLVKKFSADTDAESTSSYAVNIQPSQTTTYSASDSDVRRTVAAEIRAQSGQYKTAAEKRVVEQMAQTVEYFAVHGYEAEQNPQNEYSMPVQSAPSEPVGEARIISMKEYETPWKKLQVLDGATILLYLGALFLLASIGLYVGLGSGTTIKALLVTVLTFGFYGGGVYLHRYTDRLKPVGGTFASIGMATLPMAGAAVYYYALDRRHGALIWLITSIVAVILYYHAMRAFQSLIVSYMIVFSSISVVLSGISSLGLAPHYFIQGLGFAGLLISLLSRLAKNREDQLPDAYTKTSMVLVPFSIAMSILFVLQVGWVQLGLSLLLGLAFYAYQAVVDASRRVIYVLMAQIFGIASVGTFSYALRKQGIDVAIAAVLLAVTYLALWLGIFARKPQQDIYRSQIRYLLFFLPFIAVLATIATPGSMWWALMVTILVMLSIYSYERDVASGLFGIFAIVGLPIATSHFALESALTDFTMVVLYAVLMAIGVGLRFIFRRTVRDVDTILQQLFSTVAMSIFVVYLVNEKNTVQMIMSLVAYILFLAQGLTERSRSLWLGTLSLAYLPFGLFFIDSAKLFFALIIIQVVVNLTLASLQKFSAVHDWLVAGGLLLLAPLYGETVAQQDWSMATYTYYYGALYVIFLLARCFSAGINAISATFGYLSAVCIALITGLSYGSMTGLIVVVLATLVFYASEFIEKSRAFAYIAPFIPLLYVFSGSFKSSFMFICLLAILGFSTVVSILRKREFESYVASVATVTSLVYVLQEMTGLAETQKMLILFATTLLAILLRLFARSSQLFWRDAPMLLYSLSLGMATVYLSLATWTGVALGLFILGMLLTAISYVERQPIIIVPALLAGFGSILQYGVGYKLGVTNTTILLAGLAHASYWLLCISRLKTVRARYARLTLMSVAGLIPLVGLGYAEYSIFPLTLALFGAMLLREVWAMGQGAREVGVVVIHIALLWWLYLRNVRELQIYTQLSSLVIAGFAYVRRMQKDVPATINLYLWSAVLFFTLPMVGQALTSANPAYSYLLLFEHILLIAISIVFRRSTFAWWGIIVVVASMLYQLRKLRYAALAFLGVFIISLAVYFLLRYNKPDQKG